MRRYLLSGITRNLNIGLKDDMVYEDIIVYGVDLEKMEVKVLDINKMKEEF